MRVRLLGPVDVVVGDTVRPVPGLRRKAVLAALALHPDTVVSTAHLVTVVWGDAAPATAATTLQSHMSRLRSILGRDAIQARAHGYLLALGPDASDVQAAERLVQQGTHCADRGERVRLLRQAIDLWRGGPLADLTDLTWFAGHARRLDDLLLQARHTLTEARLELGEHVEVIGELEDRSRQHPFHEQTHAQLMLALYRGGRQADALAAYQRLRRALGDELGVDPSRPLRDLESAVLRQDPHLTAGLPERHGGASAPASVVPAQLPPGPAGFTGRTAELTRLDRLAAEQDGAAGATYVLCGPAGIGKTSLAVHWARRVAAEFPDGQLYVNLRGFDPGGRALSAAEAVRGFLHAFDVPAHHIPADPEAQIGLYRSILAGKRVLLVLDNARDADQVRPLLPGAPGCMTVVTSRNDLAPLIAIEAAAVLRLGLLTPAEARDLLTRRLGPADAGALDVIVACCAGLPLALAIVAARAATSPDLPLSALADELRRTDDLDAFTAGDAATDIRAVFSWSLQALSADAATVFRLLGLHPGPDVTAPAAASLTGLPARRTRHLLTELTRAHLLTEHAPGRYTMHDLLRAYATEQARAHDSPAATHRMLDHYLHTAHAANRALWLRDPIPIAAPQPGVDPEQLAGHGQAAAWLSAEHAVLHAIMFREPDGYDRHTWQLAWALPVGHNIGINTRGYWHDNARVQAAGLLAAERAGDRTGRAHAHRNLGKISNALGDLDTADHHNHAALDLFAATGDRNEMTHVYLNLSVTADLRGDVSTALRHAERAYADFTATGSESGRAYAGNIVGWLHNRLGDPHRGLPFCLEALATFTRLGPLGHAASTWDSLGALYFSAGDPHRATACYREAIRLFHELGDVFAEADTHVNLGDGLHWEEEHAAARDAWQHALWLLEPRSHDAAREVRARLGAPVLR